MTDKNDEELGKLSFPCTIGIKAMGRQADDFEHKVKDIVASHTEPGAIVEVRCAPLAIRLKSTLIAMSER